MASTLSLGRRHHRYGDVARIEVSAFSRDRQVTPPVGSEVASSASSGRCGEV